MYLEKSKRLIIWNRGSNLHNVNGTEDTFTILHRELICDGFQLFE